MEKKIPLLTLFSLLLIGSACQHTHLAQKPKNVVFVIVDGMGPEQVKAGRIFLGNQPLSFERFPYQSTVTTHNIDKTVTDSAAAATAMATGQKVKNRTISPAKTILEYFKEQGKSTGIVTNALLTDATPAGFAAHAQFRSDTNDILRSYLEKTQPNLIAGADEPGYLKQVKASPAGYRIIQSNTQLENLKTQIKAGQKFDHVYAGFGMYPLIAGHFDRETALPLEITDPSYFAQKDIPHISQLAESSLEILNQNPKGFFVMIESGLVDWVGHKNTEFGDGIQHPNAMQTLAYEMAETNRLVQKVTQWAKSHPDTLVIVTADHETGGLQIDESKTACLGKTGCLANAKWTSGFYPESIEKYSLHTGVPVGVYATGPGSEAFAKPMDNTEFMNKILGETL